MCNTCKRCATNKKVLLSSTNITPMPRPTPNNQHGCQERCLTIDHTQVQYGVHGQVSHPLEQNKDILHKHKMSSAVANDNVNKMEKVHLRMISTNESLLRMITRFHFPLMMNTRSGLWMIVMI